MSKRRTWVFLFVLVYAILLASLWNSLKSILSWYKHQAQPSSSGWPALYASVLLGAVFGVLSMVAALAVAVPATLVTWITVVVLLAFFGKPKRTLVLEGRKITREIVGSVFKILLKEGNLVAAVCAVLGYFALIRKNSGEWLSWIGSLFSWRSGFGFVDIWRKCRFWELFLSFFHLETLFVFLLIWLWLEVTKAKTSLWKHLFLFLFVLCINRMTTCCFHTFKIYLFTGTIFFQSLHYAIHIGGMACHYFQFKSYNLHFVLELLKIVSMLHLTTFINLSTYLSFWKH